MTGRRPDRHLAAKAAWKRDRQFRVRNPVLREQEGKVSTAKLETGRELKPI